MQKIKEWNHNRMCVSHLLLIRPWVTHQSILNEACNHQTKVQTRKNMFASLNLNKKCQPTKDFLYLISSFCTPFPDESRLLNDITNVMYLSIIIMHVHKNIKPKGNNDRIKFVTWSKQNDKKSLNIALFVPRFKIVVIF